MNQQLLIEATNGQGNRHYGSDGRKVGKALTDRINFSLLKVKYLILTGLTFLLFSFSPANVTEPLKGESYTAFGSYKVVPAEESLMIGKKELVTFDLYYTNVKKPVKIAIDEKRKCVSYIVKYPNFEVQYDCDDNGLGVKMIEPRYASINDAIVQSILDQEQFNYQQVIVPEKQNMEQSLHLIACYFPNLIREEVRVN